MSSYPSTRTTTLLIGLATVGLVSIWTIGHIATRKYEAAKAEEKRNRAANPTQDKKKKKKKTTTASKAAATPAPSAPTSTGTPATAADRKPQADDDVAPPPFNEEQAREDLVLIHSFPPPASPEEIESFVMERVMFGEALAAGGPATWYLAALEFYRAVRAYPDESELLAVLERTAPKPIVTLLNQLVTLSHSMPAPTVTALPAASTSSTTSSPASASSPSDSSSVTNASLLSNPNLSTQERTALDPYPAPTTPATEVATAASTLTVESPESSAPASDNGSWEDVPSQEGSTYSEKSEVVEQEQEEDPEVVELPDVVLAAEPEVAPLKIEDEEVKSEEKEEKEEVEIKEEAGIGGSAPIAENSD